MAHRHRRGVSERTPDPRPDRQRPHRDRDRPHRWTDSPCRNVLSRPRGPRPGPDDHQRVDPAREDLAQALERVQGRRRTGAGLPFRCTTRCFLSGCAGGARRRMGEAGETRLRNGENTDAHWSGRLRRRLSGRAAARAHMAGRSRGEGDKEGETIFSSSGAGARLPQSSARRARTVTASRRDVALVPRVLRRRGAPEAACPRPRAPRAGAPSGTSIRSGHQAPRRFHRVCNLKGESHEFFEQP